jgi:hypothetical protein
MVFGRVLPTEMSVYKFTSGINYFIILAVFVKLESTRDNWSLKPRCEVWLSFAVHANHSYMV